MIENLAMSKREAIITGKELLKENLIEDICQINSFSDEKNALYR